MNDRVEEFIERLERPADDESSDVFERHCEWLADASDDEIERLLDYLLDQAVASTATAAERKLVNILVHLVERHDAYAAPARLIMFPSDSRRNIEVRCGRRRNPPNDHSQMTPPK